MLLSGLNNSVESECWPRQPRTAARELHGCAAYVHSWLPLVLQEHITTQHYHLDVRIRVAEVWIDRWLVSHEQTSTREQGARITSFVQGFKQNKQLSQIYGPNAATIQQPTTSKPCSRNSKHIHTKKRLFAVHIPMKLWVMPQRMEAMDY